MDDNIVKQCAVLVYLIHNAPLQYNINVTGIGESIEKIDNFMALHRLFLHYFDYPYTMKSGDLMLLWISMEKDSRKRIYEHVQALPTYKNYILPMRQRNEAQEFEHVFSEQDFITHVARMAFLVGEGDLLKGVQEIISRDGMCCVTLETSFV